MKIGFFIIPNTASVLQILSNQIQGLDKWKGTFTSLTALQTAHPTGEEGWSAHVDDGIGHDVVTYIWDTNDSKWVLQQGTGTEETSQSIKTKYESNPNTNAFTDNEKTKLQGINNNADKTITYLSNVSTTQGEQNVSKESIINFFNKDENTGIVTLFSGITIDYFINFIYSTLENDLAEVFQSKLVSGTNIKTINNTSLLGSGNIDIQGGSGTSLWTAITGTRASNTTITVAGDQTAIFKKGMIVRWLESSVIKWGMVSIPSTYSSPNTTITIIGCTCASIDTDSFKYSSIIGVEQFQKNFAVAGTIGATGANVANAYYATEPMYVIGADLQVGTAGTTNSTTIDINKGGTTMFTVKPTLATTVAASTTPFTADTATSLALNDKVTIDIDEIQTTAAIDLYVQLYVVPQRYFSLT